MKKVIFITACIIAIVVTGCSSEKGEVALPVAAVTPCGQVSYSAHIAPVMEANCVSCHNSSFPAYDLSTYEGVKAKVDNGSFRLRVLIIKDMPGYCVLPDSVMQQMECWIDNGAPNN